MSLETSDSAQDHLIAALLQEDSLGAVIRGHIHIEMLIHELIHLFMADPLILKRGGFTYEQSCILVTALGLKQDLLSPLKYLGNLRNDFAHKLDQELTPVTMNYFYKCFSGEDKQVINNVYSSLLRSGAFTDEIEFSQRTPKDQFALFVITLRAALLAAISQVAAEREG